MTANVQPTKAVPRLITVLTCTPFVILHSDTGRRRECDFTAFLQRPSRKPGMPLLRVTSRDCPPTDLPELCRCGAPLESRTNHAADVNVQPVIALQCLPPPSTSGKSGDNALRRCNGAGTHLFAVSPMTPLPAPHATRIRACSAMQFSLLHRPSFNSCSHSRSFC